VAIRLRARERLLGLAAASRKEDRAGRNGGGKQVPCHRNVPLKNDETGKTDLTVRIGWPEDRS
jgi:hypothetical protein